MIINLNIEYEAGYDNYVNEYKMKGDRLLLAINKINDEMSVKYNYIVIPVAIYNIIECNDYFKANEIGSTEGLRKVGSIGEFECYLDIHLPPNEILMSWDKSTSRNVKIESILDNIIQKEKKIKVIP